MEQPSKNNGKICYVEIPAVDINESASFYQKVFGWKTRKRGDGALAFDDATGAVSGTWKKGRKPASEPGLLIYIMVDDAKEAIGRIEQNGGVVVQQIGGDHPEITARFRDPGGNVLGIYQEPGR